jgi:hypothetical protein
MIPRSMEQVFETSNQLMDKGWKVLWFSLELAIVSRF